MAALAALIPAYAEVAEGDALRCVLPIAGHLLIEHQARQAAQAGARTIVLAVERVPAPLTAAIDRLRRGGLNVEVARTVADAADRIHPDERLLVIADGLIADQQMVERIAAAPSPTLLTVPDDPAHQAFERIDATARWGGLMLIDGARLSHTATMLGDWDLQSTLLRRAVQEQPRRLAAEGPLALVTSHHGIEPVRTTLIGATRGRARGWPARLIHAPIEEVAAPPLARAGTDPLAVRAGGLALVLVAALAMLLGWRGSGLALLLLSGPLDAVGRRLARLQLQAAAQPDLAARARWVALLLALLGFAANLAHSAGWGCWVLAAALAFAMAALEGERVLLAGRPALAPAGPHLLADADALILLLLPFALAGRWLTGLCALAIYAAGSFFWAQRALVRDARGQSL